MPGARTVGDLVTGVAVVLSGAVLFRVVSATLAGKLTVAVRAELITAVLGDVVAMLVNQVAYEYNSRQILRLIQELKWDKDVIQFNEEAQEWALSIGMAFPRMARLMERLDTLRVLLLLPCTYDSERLGSSIALYRQGMELWELVRLNLDASQQSFQNAVTFLTSALNSYELEFVAKNRTEMMTHRMDLEKTVVNLRRSIVQLETALPRLKRSIEYELGMHEDVDQEQEVKGL